ncbi:hypothetical protein GQ457_03G027900 [Hibiscus cannabinus]
MAFEDNLVVERGIDPYGLNLNCTPALVVANDPMLSDDPHCLAFDDADRSSTADDSKESHLQSLKESKSSNKGKHIHLLFLCKKKQAKNVSKLKESAKDGKETGENRDRESIDKILKKKKKKKKRKGI